MIDLTARGVGDAFRLLTGVAGRVRDQSPVWDGAIADRVLAANRTWWLTGGGGTWSDQHDATHARDARGGRDPRLMYDSGDLHDSATRRGASGQVLNAGASFLFIGTDVLQGLFQSKGGREPLADLDGSDFNRIAEDLADFFLTGRA